MRILVTGATGFIGSHLCPELRSAGHDVVGINKRAGDITVAGNAERLIGSARADVVIHLAALTGRLFGEMDPASTVATNALGAAYVALACAKHDVRLAYVSTSEACGDNGGRYVAESDRAELPHNLYGLTKRWGEEVAQLYAPAGLQVIRPTMPYGPGILAGWGRNALMQFLWNAHARQEIIVFRGSSRSWCWIGDLTRGMRMVVENGGLGLWSVGRDDNETSMLDVAKICCRVAGAPESLIREADPPAREMLTKRLRVDRLIGLGWRPTIALEEGVRLLYASVKDYQNGMPGGTQ